jgi:hypothetical protein
MSGRTLVLIPALLVLSACAGSEPVEPSAEHVGGILFTSGGTQTLDFESLSAGAFVEGLGTIHPDLNISTTGVNSRVIVEGAMPATYGAPNGASSVQNGCLGTPGAGFGTPGAGKGFADISGVHDYVFTFSSGHTVSAFSLLMLDYGDINLVHATQHEVKLVAFDAANNVVDDDKLSYTSTSATNPRSGSAGDLFFTGDACDASAGQPGIFTFMVSGTGIVRVELQYSNNSGTPTIRSDPNIGFDNVVFTLVIEVDIDIKPGSFPNSINPNSKGVIPVAILGSASFDVTDVDVTTLAFGPSGATPAHMAGGHLEDVNNDGFTDLVSHYLTQDTGIASGNTEACLTGQTTGGVGIEGCDSVNTVGRP